MASFIRHDLRHNTTGLDELRAADAPEPVILLFESLLKLLSGRVEIDAVRSSFVSMYRDFTSYARFFDYDMAELEDYCRRFDDEIKYKKEQDRVISTQAAQLKEIQNNRSWKITKFLRAINSLLLKQSKKR
jgi:hypothetical protein